MAVPSIISSVGKGGKNLYEDVTTIQELLNEPSVLKDSEAVPVTGKIATNWGTDPTVKAIFAYQALFLANPDGRVDVSQSPGSTLQRLRSGWSFTQLPREQGKGYYSYSSPENQHGTPATIQALRDVAKTMLASDPTHPIGIGDISYSTGGKMSGHDSHRQGRHVDIRPLRKDGERLPVTIQSTDYDQERTRRLVEALLAHKNVRAILFNDSKIKGVSWWKGHDNHLHVTMRE